MLCKHFIERKRLSKWWIEYDCTHSLSVLQLVQIFSPEAIIISPQVGQFGLNDHRIFPLLVSVCRNIPVKCFKAVDLRYLGLETNSRNGWNHSNWKLFEVNYGLLTTILYAVSDINLPISRCVFGYLQTFMSPRAYRTLGPHIYLLFEMLLLSLTDILSF